MRSGAAEIPFSRVAVLCEGQSELGALPYYAKALGIPLDALGISLVSVDGGHNYLPVLRMIGRDSLEIPWVIISDADLEESVADQLVKAGVVNQQAVTTATAAANLGVAILQPKDVFVSSPGDNFEKALILGGAAPEYEQAIRNHLGPNALATHLAGNPGLTTLEDQLISFMGTRRGQGMKVLLAGEVADAITQGGADPGRIPTFIVDALRTAESFATGQAAKSF